jgi:putative toxin-antitoxin system antitoxin component (TIGR02293 family)
MIVQVEGLLGGSAILGKPIHTDMDLYKLSKQGIPKLALVEFVQNIGTSMRAMAKILHVTERTLQRKNDLDLLSEDISEHVIQIAEVYMRGNQVFDSNDDFVSWMHAANTALANQKPYDMLSSRYGVQLILNELGRIEHGIYS